MALRNRMVLVVGLLVYLTGLCGFTAWSTARVQKNASMALDRQLLLLKMMRLYEKFYSTLDCGRPASTTRRN